MNAHSGRFNSQPRKIPLTEDDPNAMETLCEMLHFRYDFTTMGNIDDDSLTAFAFTCNKYDCCRAVAAFSRRILSLNRMRIPTDTYTYAFLASAYLLRDAQEFNTMAFTIMHDSTRSFEELRRQNRHFSLIPEKAIGSVTALLIRTRQYTNIEVECMEHDRAAAFHTIAVGLQSPIEKFLSEESHSSRPRNSRLLSKLTSKTAPEESGIATTVSNAIAAQRTEPRDCPNNHAIMVQYLQELYKHQLFPIATSDHSVHVNLERIKLLKARLVRLATTDPKILLCPGNCSCREYSQSIIEDMDNLVTEAFAHMRKFCLSCLSAESDCNPFCPKRAYHRR